MKSFISHFEIHSRFRNGIFVLSIILLASTTIYYFYKNSLESQNSFVELTQFQEQIDSLMALNTQKKEQDYLKPFNPNFISEYKGYVLGLSAQEMDRLHAYRKEDKWINSVSDFKNVTNVSDSLLKVISPLFKFPEWKKGKNTPKATQKKYPVLSYSQKGDLNTVSAEVLQKDCNLPDFIAVRIIKYRTSVGGFINDIQLKDVSGLYSHQQKKILSLFTVKTPKKIKKININAASVQELIEVPYFDFETALAIKDFIESNGTISDFNELKKIEGFSLEKIDRIALYLTLN